MRSFFCCCKGRLDIYIFEGMERMGIDIIFKISFFAARVFYFKETIIKTNKSCPGMESAYPVDGPFYLDAAGIIAAATFWDVAAINSHNVPVFIFLKILTSYDVSSFKSYH